MGIKMNKLTKKRSAFGQAFCDGLRDGLPIGLGYLAVSFSLGIAAKNAGLNAFQGFLASFLNNASAGEYAGFTVIASNASYFEMALITLIANARYLLMSCALSQRIPPKLPIIHRLLAGHYITDELFGVAVSRPGSFDIRYLYGAILAAAPCWSAGTVLGVLAGNLLPANVVSALSVMLFGMFLAVIVPAAKKDRAVAGCVCLSFAASFLASRAPLLGGLSEGTRTILLTLGISAAAALLFPVKIPSEKSEGGDCNDT